MYLVLILLLTDCSVEKNTGTTRFYHGLTSRFNIYFNGYESFKAGLIKINKGYNDDFAELLKVFEYSDPSTVSLCSSDMDRAIQKASKVITLKSITAKPEVNSRGEPSEKEKELLEKKEYNEWVDDCYLLIGKARFYKHEYDEASAIFNYCIAEANDPLIKTEASIWVARVFNETALFNESLRILKETDITAYSSKSLNAIYYTTMADLYIKQKRYSEAIEPLSLAIKYISGKRSKYRLTYLLAQLYEQSGQSDKAISLYRDVVKMNLPYDVEFNARINIAGVFDTNSGNPGEIRRELQKMLRDSKNKDYHDQIYYALGNLSMKEGNEKEALEFYRRSATASSQNQNQKGRSYLALAGYYYNKSDYINAGKYYDSAVFFLDQKYPDYQVIRTKSQNLNTLVTELIIIQTEDSLQRVATMSESERNTLISNIINKIVKEEQEGKTSEYADRYNLGQYYENERRFQGNITQEGKWYFYNQAALTFGRTEFRRRWGERRLEDNWRRSNKARTTLQATVSQEETIRNGADTSSVIQDYKTPEFYLRNLPLNDSLLDISNRKIASAYLNAGIAYSEKLNEQSKAVESFESVINRYPDSELVPEVLYNLSKVYRDKVKDNQRSETYRQRLLERFPESEFAEILSDPDYYKKRMAESRLVEQLYQEAYDKYISENFSDAITQCDLALINYGKDELAPKFFLLKAYSVARISDERSFKEQLTSLIKQYPGTEESVKAAEIIASINEKIPELKVEEEKEIAAELFVADTSASHIFVLIIMDPAFNLNQAAFDVISYNIDNYTNQNYRTEGLLVDNRYIMIKVSGFQDYSKAWDYYRNSATARFLRNASGARIMTFLINNNNLQMLEKDKNPERYLLFFNENYLYGNPVQ
jgi:tetratricopeptide (TPR) repeat protein